MRENNYRGHEREKIKKKQYKGMRKNVTVKIDEKERGVRDGKEEILERDKRENNYENDERAIRQRDERKNQ